MVEALGNGRYLVSGTRDSGLGARDTRRLAYAVGDKGRTWVFIDGRTYVVESGERDAPARTRATDDQLALSSPMPATVVSIAVAGGQTVAEGDLLVMLEAMKMELPIKAPRAGRVRSIDCRVGELVQPGMALLALD